MANILNRVIDIAKKLRRVAKKSGDPGLQDLITDLSLGLADLKVQMAEQYAAAHGAPALDSELAIEAEPTEPTDAPATEPATTTVRGSMSSSGDLGQNSADSLQYLGRRHDSPGSSS